MKSVTGEATRGPRVLITGAEGFVGGWLRRRLLKVLPAEGILICASKLTPNKLAEAPDSSEIAIGLDLENESTVYDVVGHWKPDVVVHLAAVSHVVDAERDPKTTLSVNFGGTVTLARAVMELAPAARFLNVSSSEVYGGSFIGANEPLREDAALDPFNSYAASKAAADIVIGQMSREGLQSIRFRPFNHTGSGQSDRFVVSGFASQIARIEKGLQPPVISVGNLDAVRDFTDVRDIVDAYIAAALFSREMPVSGSIYNLCSGKPRQIGAILEELLAMAVVPIRVEKDPLRMRGSEVPTIVGNAGKAKEKLGWSPQISWNETLQGVLNYWRGVS